MRAVADTNVYISALNFGGTAEEVLALGRAEVVELFVSRPKETIHLITEDEPDNRILECALEAQADVVITGDKHLRQLETFRDVLIVSPREFLEIYRAGPRSS